MLVVFFAVLLAAVALLVVVLLLAGFRPQRHTRSSSNRFRGDGGTNTP